MVAAVQAVLQTEEASVILEAPADGSVVRGTVEVSGTASPEGTVTVSVDGTDVGTADGGSPTFSFALDTLALAEGEREITATLTSAVGTASDSVTVVVDNCPPWSGPGHKKPPKSCRGR